MPWGVPTGRLKGILDDGTQAPPPMPQPDLQAPTLGILGSVARPDIVGAMKAATTPSFFGQGGVGRNIAGYIGDALQRLGGGQGTFAQAQALQRQQDYQAKQATLRQQLEEMQYQRHRADTMADWKTQHQWSLNNAEPTGLDAQIAALKKNGATDADIQTFVHNKIDPVHMATGIDANGNTILTPYRASQFGAPGGPPPAAVAHLKLHPELAPSFEAKFGKGSAARYLNGGATPPASGTFPQASGDGTGRGGGLGSFRSSAYDALEAPIEQELGIPSGLMRAVRTRGEMSNASQVSPAGAQTVYQVIPATRAGVIRNYGVDAYSDPQSAARAAALVLKEGYKRTGSWLSAVQQYHGGTNPANYGPVNRAYVARVAGGL